jgi:hypothetical protein
VVDWGQLVGVGVGAVTAVAVSQLEGRRSRTADRASRSADAAEKSRSAVDVVRDLYHEHYDFRLNSSTDRPSLQSDERLAQALRDLRNHVWLIGDDRVRSRLSFVARGLGYPTAIAAFHGDGEQASSSQLCDYGWETLSAYVRGDKLPAEPGRIRAYRAAVAEADEVQIEAAELPPPEVEAR